MSSLVPAQTSLSAIRDDPNAASSYTCSNLVRNQAFNQVQQIRADNAYFCGAGHCDKKDDMKHLMDGHGSGVVVGFHVENMTSYPLTDTIVRMKGGAMDAPFRDMQPSSSKMFVATKNFGTATGCYGTVSWKISPRYGDSRRVVVMWSAPYSHIFYNNYMAVGISDASSNPTDRDWFTTMYGSTVTGSHEKKFRKNGLFYHRNSFSKAIKQVSVSEGGICMEGSMGTHHKAQVFITIREK